MKSLKEALKALRNIAGLSEDNNEVNSDQEYFDELRAKKDARVEGIKENRINSFNQMLSMKEKVEGIEDERSPEERRKALAREIRMKQKKELGMKWA